jgi:signal transduction histidine kinase
VIAWLRRLDEAFPRPLERLGSIKLKFTVLLLASGAVGGLLQWVSLGTVPPRRIGLAVLVSIAVGLVLAHGTTKPLREMTAAARAMARGDYSVRVRATASDEIGQLATAFNQMAADLEASDRQRRELIANVSHELRTPITALHALLENLADGVAKPGPAELGAAVAQTDRLGRLVAELLDLSRLDAGVTPLEPVQFALRPFLEKAIAEATYHNGAQTHLDVPPDLTAHADVQRLHQVVANLLSNAIRHNRPDGTVTVRARERDAQLVLEVADEGPGIAAADRDRVLERFMRGERSTRDGGTGLGLAIARWIVELHGGRISVADAEVGCVIRVELPSAQTDPDGRAAVADA